MDLRQPGVTFSQAKKGQRYYSSDSKAPSQKKFSLNGMEDVKLTQPGYGLEGGWDEKIPDPEIRMPENRISSWDNSMEIGPDGARIFNKQPAKTKKLSDDKASAFQSFLNRLKNVN